NALRQSSSLSLSERSRLDGEGKQLEQEIIYLKGALSRSEQTDALHLKEKSVADGRLKSLAGENAMLRQKADSMEMKMKAFDQSNAVLTRENKRLVAHQNEYDRMKAANDSLLNGLRSSQSEIASLKNQLTVQRKEFVQGSSAVVRNSQTQKNRPKIKAQVITDKRSIPLRPKSEINEVISGFKIIGVNRSSRGDKIILNGNIFVAGEIVDYAREITFLRLEGNEIVFSGPDSAEYRLKL
ncbi:MAG: hypothetical protein JKY51_10325, partial [Opitutaceae bacterium]|nr:hypothetical protein [Opitutaceae bacterium]